MWRLIILLFIFLNSVSGNDDKTMTVMLEDGAVMGTKYWNGDFYEFYGIPYALAPTGRDRFQAPLPVEPWDDVLDAKDSKISCYQAYFTDEDDEDEFILSGDYDCLHMNLLVPEVASANNLVPVLAYIHSGAFAGGSGNMARFHYLARHDVIVISFNYRLGPLGFACLGNKEIPGNAGMKDQVAALKWIKRNVQKFGGDPNKVTLAGYSVGASMAELLTLSKTTDGLINQLILESGSSLAPFTINRDPIDTAKNLAFAMGYNGTETLEDLTEFYLNVTIETMVSKSLNFFLSNSTFGYSPCIENVLEGIEPFLTESPLDIMKRGQHTKIPMLTGFSDMEGISRTIKFGEWRERMTEDFSEFLPVDLKFETVESKQELIKQVKERYFQGSEVNHEKLQGYVDYFSAVMFKYPIMKSLRLQAATTKRPLYLYEFSYVGKLSLQHNYMDRLKGATHRDQTGYILDFYGWTNNYKDLDMRDRMTAMWTDFVKYGDPTAYESTIINYKWLPYTNENQNYLHISKKQTMKKNLFVDEFNFWDKLYDKYHWSPTAPKPPKVEKIAKTAPEIKQEAKNDKTVKKEEIKKVNSDKKEHIKIQPEVKTEKKESDLDKKDTKVKQETVKENIGDNRNTKENNKPKQVNIKEQKVENAAKKDDSKAKQENIQRKKVKNVAQKEDKNEKDHIKVAEIKIENNKNKEDAVRKQKLDDIKKDPHTPLPTP